MARKRTEWRERDEEGEKERDKVRERESKREGERDGGRVERKGEAERCLSPLSPYSLILPSRPPHLSVSFLHLAQLQRERDFDYLPENGFFGSQS